MSDEGSDVAALNSLPPSPSIPEDPVALGEPVCPDSLTKFALDVFASKETSGMFYTTDLMVLIDIVLRQISDLCPGDKVGGANYIIVIMTSLTKLTKLPHFSPDPNTLFGVIVSYSLGNRLSVTQPSAEGDYSCSQQNHARGGRRESGRSRHHQESLARTLGMF